MQDGMAASWEKGEAELESVWGAGSDSATSMSQLLSFLGSLCPRTSYLLLSPTWKKLLTCGIKIGQREELFIVREMKTLGHLCPR